MQLLYEKNCPKYIQEKETVTDGHHQNEFLQYKELFRRLSVYTGSNISSPTQVMQLSNLLISQVNIQSVYNDLIFVVVSNVNVFFIGSYENGKS